MRHKFLGGLLLSAWIGVWPLAAHADYLSSARAALQKGDLRSAKIELRNAVRADPQNAEAHYWLGMVSLQLGDPVAAEREAKAARERGYDAKRTVPLLARALLGQHRFRAVLDQLHPNTNNPDVDATILVYRGYAQIGLGHPDQAKASFEQAARTAPNSVEPLLAEARLAEAHGDLTAAQDSIDRAVAIQPRLPAVMLAKSALLRMKHDGDGALKVLDDLVAQNPSLLQARLERASLEIALGKVEAAKKDLAAVQKAMPGNVQAIYLRAVIAAQNKDFKAADADLQKISPFISRIPRAYYLVGVVKEQLGDIAQAQEAASRYLARAPDDPNANKLAARIDFARGRPDQVIETLTKMVNSGKADAEIYDMLGRAYAATHRGAEAVAAFQKAQKLAPNNVGVQTRLATARLGIGEPTAALGDLEHTLKIAPKVPAVGEALFFAALATGDMHKATHALEQVRAAQGDTPVVENLQGMLQLAELNIEGAHQTFAAIADKHPDFLPAQINLARVTAMQGHGKKAAKILAGILDKHPGAEPALTMLAADYLQTGQMPKALALVERAHAAEPKNSRLTASLGKLYIRDNKPQKAIELVNAQKDAEATSLPIMGLKVAAQLALGEKDKAIATYTDILQADPRLDGVRQRLIKLLVDDGNYQQARNVVEAGFSVSPHNYQFFQDYAMIDLKDKGLQTALATAEQLQSQNAAFVPALALKGDIYLAANRPDDAMKAYADAEKASPSPMLVMRLAGAQVRLGRKDAAIKTLQDWTTQHPDDLAVREQLAEMQITAGQMDAAVKNLQAILAKKPHDPVALNNLAWVYQQQKDSRALDLARQAYTLAPSAQTADTLGWILVTSGKPKTGVALLRQASAQGHNDPRILYHYAVALNDTGNKGDAIEVLKAVVSAQGNFTEKTEAQKLLTRLTKGA